MTHDEIREALAAASNHDDAAKLRVLKNAPSWLAALLAENEKLRAALIDAINADEKWHRTPATTTTELHEASEGRRKAFEAARALIAESSP